LASLLYIHKSSARDMIRPASEAAMKRGEVISLRDYRAERLVKTGAAGRAGVSRALPDADQLRELLDRNISLEVWKRGV